MTMNKGESSLTHVAAGQRCELSFGRDNTRFLTSRKAWIGYSLRKFSCVKKMFKVLYFLFGRYYFSRKPWWHIKNKIK